MNKKQAEKIVKALTGLKKLWRNGKGWLQVGFKEQDEKGKMSYCVLAGLEALKFPSSNPFTNVILEELNVDIPQQAYDDHPVSLSGMHAIVSYNDWYATEYADVRNIVTRTIKRLRKQFGIPVAV